MAISFKEVLNQSLQDFWSKKIRTFVTVLGVVLGTASIIIVMSLVQGTTKQTLEWLEENGGFTKVNFNRNWEFDKPTSRRKSLEYEEVKRLVSKVEGIETLNIEIFTHTSTKYNSAQFNGRVQGVDLDYFKIKEWPVSTGRTISSFDLAHNKKVALIGTIVRQELFGSVDPIGKFIDIDGNKFTIIGILERQVFEGKGNMGQGNWLEWENRNILVPVTTILNLKPSLDRVRSFELQTKSIDYTKYVQDRLVNLINKEFSNKPVWRAESNLEQREVMERESSKFTIIFYFISGISLIVGGIVIMNIMLATIKERTREIGVRMSIGGSRMDIFLQFLIQTIIVTTLGGLVGILIGTSLVNYVGNYLGANVAITSKLILIALVMSSGVGFIFGIIPSWKACSLDPVKALRTE